jgi:hypothetical protein
MISRAARRTRIALSDGIAQGQPRRAYVNFAGAGLESAEVAFAPDVAAGMRECDQHVSPEDMRMIREMVNR